MLKLIGRFIPQQIQVYARIRLPVFNEQGDLLWYFQTNSAIQSPILITNNDIAIFGNMTGGVYILKLNSSGLNKFNATNYEWSTFKGNNKRTGN